MATPDDETSRNNRRIARLRSRYRMRHGRFKPQRCNLPEADFNRLYSFAVRALLVLAVLLLAGARPVLLHASPGDPQGRETPRETEPASLTSLITRSPYDPARYPNVAAWQEGQAHLEAAGHYAAAGDWERTFIVLSRAATALPDDPDIRASLARVSVFRDRQLGADEQTRLARLAGVEWSATTPSLDARGHLETARMYVSVGDWEHAFAVLSRALVVLPDDPDIQVHYARVSALRDQQMAQQNAAVARAEQTVRDLGQFVQSSARTLPAMSALDFDSGAAPQRAADARGWLVLAGLMTVVACVLGWRRIPKGRPLQRP